MLKDIIDRLMILIPPYNCFDNLQGFHGFRFERGEDFEVKLLLSGDVSGCAEKGVVYPVDILSHIRRTCHNPDLHRRSGDKQSGK